MNDLTPLTTAPQTMSSREIAELVQSRHDKVKQSIDRLAERGIIDLPPLGEYLDTLGRKATEYRIGKRDSYVIVAQLSPEFTAQLVDRWQQLEEQVRQPMDPRRALSDPASLRTLLLENVEKVIALEGAVEEMRPQVQALRRIAIADGSLNITETAKALQVRPKDLFTWLQSNHWIYRRAGGKGYIGYQAKIMTGLVEHKVTTVPRGDGPDKIVEQVLVTTKGLTKLAEAMR